MASARMLPLVVVNDRYLRDITGDACVALIRANWPPTFALAEPAVTLAGFGPRQGS